MEVKRYYTDMSPMHCLKHLGMVQIESVYYCIVKKDIFYSLLITVNHVTITLEYVEWKYGKNG